MRASAADDPTIADAPSSASVIVSPPPPPDYTVSFNAAMPWSGLVGTAMSLTGTCQLTIQNLNANPGSKGITWTVHLSTDNVLDGLDLPWSSRDHVGALAGSGSTTVGYAGNWPGPRETSTGSSPPSHAPDDSDPTNNVVPAPARVRRGQLPLRGRRREQQRQRARPNPAMPQTSDTGLMSPVPAANETLVIEGTMDATGQLRHLQVHAVAVDDRLSICARWATGMDDLDLYVWDTVDGRQTCQPERGRRFGAGAGPVDIRGNTRTAIYVSPQFWRATSDAPYVILVAAALSRAARAT